jgi:hypothetical protein
VVKKGRFAPAHTRRVGVYTANAFAPGRFDTLTEGHLCVPTRLVSP